MRSARRHSPQLAVTWHRSAAHQGGAADRWMSPRVSAAWVAARTAFAVLRSAAQRASVAWVGQPGATLGLVAGALGAVVSVPRGASRAVVGQAVSRVAPPVAAGLVVGPGELEVVPAGAARRALQLPLAVVAPTQIAGWVAVRVVAARRAAAQGAVVVAL